MNASQIILATEAALRENPETGPVPENVEQHIADAIADALLDMVNRELNSRLDSLNIGLEGQYGIEAAEALSEQHMTRDAGLSILMDDGSIFNVVITRGRAR